MSKVLIVSITLLVVCFSCFAQVPLHRELILPLESMPATVDLRLQDLQDTGSKSTTVAVLLSLVLPGAGEWYAGDFDSGKYFLIADGALWLTYGSFQFRGDWLREDAHTFAVQHAGATFDGNDDKYEVNVGNYMTVDDYNQARLRERRYDELYTGSNSAWRWDNDVNRLRFRSQRIEGGQMYENAKFVVGALVVNRLISAFSAGRAAARSAMQGSDRGAWQMGALLKGGFKDAHGIEVKFSREF